MENMIEIAGPQLTPQKRIEALTRLSALDRLSLKTGTETVAVYDVRGTSLKQVLTENCRGRSPVFSLTASEDLVETPEGAAFALMHYNSWKHDQTHRTVVHFCPEGNVLGCRCLSHRVHSSFDTSPKELEFGAAVHFSDEVLQRAILLCPPPQEPNPLDISM